MHNRKYICENPKASRYKHRCLKSKLCSGRENRKPKHGANETCKHRVMIKPQATEGIGIIGDIPNIDTVSSSNADNVEYAGE